MASEIKSCSFCGNKICPFIIPIHTDEHGSSISPNPIHKEYNICFDCVNDHYGKDKNCLVCEVSISQPIKPITCSYVHLRMPKNTSTIMCIYKALGKNKVNGKYYCKDHIATGHITDTTYILRQADKQEQKEIREHKRLGENLISLQFKRARNRINLRAAQKYSESMIKASELIGTNAQNIVNIAFGNEPLEGSNESSLMTVSNQ